MSGLNARFIAHLEAGGTVLTASRRQARIIRRLHDRAQHAAGRRCWPTGDVIPLEAWLTARWQEAASAGGSLPVLLDEAQAAWPWRRAAEALQDTALVALPDLAGAARHAWVALQRYGATLTDLEGQFLTRDQQQFLGWSRRVEAELEARGWVDPALLDMTLTRHATALVPTAPLLLAGFDRPAPSLRRLLEHLVRVGFRVETAPIGGTDGTARLYAAADPLVETHAWLAWARQRLESNPDARLAVIVPDLQARRDALERGLEAALQPELELPGTLERDRIFDLAGGQPLERLAIAQVALDSIDCSAARVEVERLSRLLRSRYVTPADALDVRARMDIALRRAGLHDWPVAGLSRLARDAGCPALAEALEATRRLLQQGPGRRPTDDWAGAFGEVLAAWGWPGPGPLASDEYQAAEALRKRLAQFAALCGAAPQLTLVEARAEFRRLSAGPFEPERGDPVLWVLDTLEAPGVEFDGLWVAGMTAARWPRAASHDPFLPLPLQRQLGMPGVTSEDALGIAQRTVNGWRATAEEVVFSWPATEDDARVEPSRVLPAGLPAIGVPPGSATRAEGLLGACATEPLGPDPAPAVRGDAYGGARILELQAKCPFRAFAELRLAAPPLEEPATGVDARARGTVLHEALEHIWRALGRRSALEAMSPESLEALVEASLERALAAGLPGGLGPRARELEREWQREAIGRLLDLDMDRADFEVAYTEAPLEQSLAGLQLRLRVDRIDRIAAGLVVLDYKTGRAAIGQWRGVRPDAPQLPLYAVLSREPIVAVAFASVGAHQAAFRGVGRSAGLLPGIVAAERFELTDTREAGFDWDHVRGRWAAWLGALAAGHQRGEAAVDPKLPQTCRQCHLQTLCRVAPGFVAAEEVAGDG